MPQGGRDKRHPISLPSAPRPRVRTEERPHEDAVAAHKPLREVSPDTNPDGPLLLAFRVVKLDCGDGYTIL